MSIIQTTPNKPSMVPWTPGRLASMIVPADGTMFWGGDATITADGNQTQGIQLLAGQPYVAGPEDGDSPTWIITNSATTVHVGICEWLPA